jgi:hypothetical protein
MQAAVVLEYQTSRQQEPAGQVAAVTAVALAQPISVVAVVAEQQMVPLTLLDQTAVLVL